MNRVYLSDLLPAMAAQTCRNLSAILKDWNVETEFLHGTKDIWCRDFMPVQVDAGRFQSYRYHPDYLRNDSSHRTNNIPIAGKLGIPLNTIMQDIILDGGNVVRCGNKVIMTAKVFEENPGYRPFNLLDILEAAFDSDIIVLPWDTNEIFGHADGICRHVDGDTVLMTNYRQFDKDMAVRFRKCLEPHFSNVVELEYKHAHKDSWAYVNWLQTDKVVVIPALGCDTDCEALEQIENVLPSYKGRIVMCRCNDVIRNGGGLNCCSWTVMA